MTLREVLLAVAHAFPLAKEQEFAGHPFARFMAHEVPAFFDRLGDGLDGLLWKASAGQGQWAEAPWIAALDPLVTNTPQDGYYPAYLYSRDMKIVYLSLNQGMTQLRDELGRKDARETLVHRARILRNRVADRLLPRFQVPTIKLGARKRGERLDMYEPGHAFGVRYDVELLPEDEQLVSDLTEMLSLYSEATIEGGTIPLDDAPYAEIAGRSLEERRQLRLHLQVERNRRLAKLAKKAHGAKCQICGFSFRRVYGIDYIEAHHRVPLSKIAAGGRLLLSPKRDFAVVCANCHRVLHSGKAPVDFDECSRWFRNGANRNRQ